MKSDCGSCSQCVIICLYRNLARNEAFCPRLYCNMERKNLPLRIDLLIIRKKAGEVIKNEIGTFFLGHNIIEYKSPDDSMNIDTFIKYCLMPACTKQIRIL